MATFTIKNLTFTYPMKNTPVLKNIDLEIGYGQFITICGQSGSGKTTLLRNLKSALAPHGSRSGEILFYGRQLDSVDRREQSQRIGYVLQNPENQIVTDKVWHELAFGLESLGYDKKTIRLRVAEMASFFGIQTWFMKNVSDLSGGQKQILNLAAVMAMQPDVLILDEPTSQLDPIAAEAFLEMVLKINKEIGTTVIISEHRLEGVFSMADRVIVMDDGRIVANDTPENTGAILAARKHKMFMVMPAPLKIYAELYEQNVRRELPCPVTVRDGRNWLTKLFENEAIKTTALDATPVLDQTRQEPVISMKDVWFKYNKNDNDVIKDLSLEIFRGEMFCVLGGNGTGKTTTLKLISGIQKAYRGKMRLKGVDIEKYKKNELFSGIMAMLPQNPQSVFVKNTVRLDLMEMMEGRKNPAGMIYTDDAVEKMVSEMAKLVEIEHLLDMHPYDLSGGEQQRAALAKVLLLEPEILLLDEPTKGMDNYFKKKLAGILKKLLDKGVTVVVVSHDIEFCGSYGDRCAMFFDGNIVTQGVPRTFFSGNSFYTTAANRMSRHIFENAVTSEDVVALIRKNLDLPEPVGEDKSDGGGDVENDRHEKTEIKSGKSESVKPAKSEAAAKPEATNPVHAAAKLKTGTKLATFILLAMVPITLYAGMFWLNDRKYYFISLLILAYSMIPFFMVFEGKKPRAREIIIIAVLIAIAVIGRAAFFMVPQFKPVIAIVIIAGACLGSQAGFMTGAMTAFVSNFFFGQGPWTPWQMFALGLIGLLSGYFIEKGLLKERRNSLMVFGALATVFIYGGLVDLWTIFGMGTGEGLLQWAISVYTLALPFNLINAAATVIFLYFLAKPMIEKIDRIKIKYGLVY